MGRRVGRQVHTYETAKEGEREKGLGRGKEGEGTGIAGLNRGHPAVNPTPMTQSWSMVTMYLRSGSPKAGIKIGIWVHVIY